MPMNFYAIKLSAFLFFVPFLFSCGASRKASGSGKLSAVVKYKYANMMKVPVSKIENARLYNFIEEWWGVRYQYGGNTKSGVDCSGFTVQLYEKIYHTKLSRTTALQYKEAKHIKKQSKLKEGDLVFFTTQKNKQVSHVGVYLCNDYFVHANNNGVTINNLHDLYWEPRYICGGKMKE